MSFGISKKDVEYIIETIKKYHEVEKAVIFGSRAIGNFKNGSDVDIALFGDHVSFSVIAQVKDELQEESPMPYLFDIVDCTHSKSDVLKDHISKFGIPLFSRNQNVD